MSDVFSPVKRSEIMSHVHSKNTTPEIKVRKLLHKMGYRFRLYRNDLPGKPDIVLSKYQTVIFVHGCFWHGCPICKHAQKRPRSNSDYWNQKLDNNLKRDKNNALQLEKLGWHVLIIWECETRISNLPLLQNKLSTFLS